MEQEIWKDIVGYEGLYKVSNLGRVKSLRLNKIMGTGNKRYTHLILVKNKVKKTYDVHRLVAQAFIPNPLNKEQVNHIDGNKQNNCVDNLEWTTIKENMKHAYKNNLYKYHKRIKIKVCQIKNNRIIKTYDSISQASNETKINATSIGYCLKGKYNKAGGYIWKAL